MFVSNAENYFTAELTHIDQFVKSHLHAVVLKIDISGVKSELKMFPRTQYFLFSIVREKGNRFLLKDNFLLFLLIQIQKLDMILLNYNCQEESLSKSKRCSWSSKQMIPLILDPPYIFLWLPVMILWLEFIQLRVQNRCTGEASGVLQLRIAGNHVTAGYECERIKQHVEP